MMIKMNSRICERDICIDETISGYWQLFSPEYHEVINYIFSRPYKKSEGGARRSDC